MELIIAITGASGVIYGIRLLEILKTKHDCKTHLIISENAKQLLEFETEYDIKKVQKLANKYYENSELSASISSGSKFINSMVIIPCSMSTAAKINTGITDNLIIRAADVCIKENRKLIIVPRESPMNTTHLKNLLELSQKSVTVLPAAPAFYSKPKSVKDQIDFIVGKVMDNLGIDHNLYRRWSGKK